MSGETPRQRRIEGATFVLEANGMPGTPPADGVREYLLREGARRVLVVHHPLGVDDAAVHHVAGYSPGQPPSERVVRLPSRPPATYLFDPLVPLRPPRADCWIGFNSLAALRGLAARRVHRAGSVVYWAVDFVPDRFGTGIVTRIFDRVDRHVCRGADLRVEVSAAARDGRAERLELGPGAAPATVAPIGVWLDEVSVTAEDAWRTRRLVYAGHLVPRQGVDELVRAMALVTTDGVTLDVVGRGPERERLEELARQCGVDGRVRFRGFLPDHADVDRALAAAAIGVAPYRDDPASFTRFADPAKARSYAAAGLPTILTDVPPNAHELAQRGGAEIVAFDAASIAAAIDRLLASPEEWARRRGDALAYASGFDWSQVVSEALAPLGYTGASRSGAGSKL